MQWTAFEPNDKQLWAQVTAGIRLFLRGQWHTDDETAMAQDDIDNGAWSAN
jgi:phage tail sheath protein FI